MSDEIQYPYLPEGRTFKFVPRDHVFMQAADKARDEKAGDPINPVGVALVRDGQVLVTAGNGHNRGQVNVHICPRVVLECKTGEGYDLCTFHDSPGHAEPSSVAEAKRLGIDLSTGFDAYMSGHWWACEPCWQSLIDAGLKDFYIVENAHEVFDKKNVHKETLVPSIKTAYLSGALTESGPEERALYETLQKATAEVGVELYCPHQHTDPLQGTTHTSKEIYELDKTRVTESEVVVAYIGFPSLGVGMEIEMASALGKPVVLLTENGKRVPRIVGGAPSVVYTVEFENPEDAARKLQQVLKQL